jgi:ferredoxin
MASLLKAGLHDSNPFFTNKRNIFTGVNELVAVVDNDKCTGCETCVSECPASAIAMENDKAKIDKDMCVDCQTCVDVCPSEAIHME